MILNFGHALETISGYGKLRHGEAVGIGMIIAARLSQEVGILRKEEADRVERLISSFGLPVKPPRGINYTRFDEILIHDKKRSVKKLNFVLPEKNW